MSPLRRAGDGTSSTALLIVLSAPPRCFCPAVAAAATDTSSEASVSAALAPATTTSNARADVALLRLPQFASADRSQSVNFAADLTPAQNLT